MNLAWHWVNVKHFFHERIVMVWKDCHATLLSLAFITLLSLFDQVEAATVKTKSVSLADVSSAIASAQDGDTVTLPAGTAEWETTLVVSKAITIQGAGIGMTIIRDNVVGKGPKKSSILNLSTTAGKFYRITGIEFTQGTRTKRLGKGMVRVSGDSSSVRVDHCKFNSNYNRALTFFDAVTGVVDHCEMIDRGIYVDHANWGKGSFGQQSFADDPNYGSGAAVYVEDCTFTRAAIDAEAGARYVFRHNTVISGTVVTHGSENKGGPGRGTRLFEIYDNIFRSGNSRANAIHIRSGSGVIFNNIASDYKHLCTLNHYRATHDHFYWGISNGKLGWDDNLVGGPFQTGKHTGENNSTSLTDSTKNWKPNQWIGYSILNTTTGRASVVMSNNNTTVLQWPEAGHVPSQGGGHMMTFNTGDSYEFWKINNAMDMPGMGKSDLLFPPAHPKVGFPHQAIEGIYGWNNKMDGADAGIVCPKYPFIVEGTHFFNNKPKPGYKPFTYPHPLVSGVPATPRKAAEDRRRTTGATSSSNK